MDITDEYVIEALMNTARYAFYKNYVEDLEIEHDELIDEVESLEIEVSNLKKENRQLKAENKKLKKKIGFNPDDYDRLKKQNLELIKRLKMRRS